MESVITTIFYDGQFWTAVVERISEGSIETARHIFGSEPGNAELLEFYLHHYDRLSFLSGKHNFRVRKKYSAKEQQRMSNKSHDIFKAALEQQQLQRKKERAGRQRLEEGERYRQKQQKKKNKRRGH